MNKQKRLRRVRAKIRNVARPRLTVFRSKKAIYGQIIDDAKGRTLVAANSLKPRTKNSKVTKTERAFTVGETLAKKALRKKIKRVVFDRGPYRYHGRVKALAEGAKKRGLQF